MERLTPPCWSISMKKDHGLLFAVAVSSLLLGLAGGFVISSMVPDQPHATAPVPDALDAPRRPVLERPGLEPSPTLSLPPGMMS
jgi:hypothetical protein